MANKAIVPLLEDCKTRVSDLISKPAEEITADMVDQLRSVVFAVMSAANPKHGNVLSAESTETVWELVCSLWVSVVFQSQTKKNRVILGTTELFNGLLLCRTSASMRTTTATQQTRTLLLFEHLPGIAVF
jgi:hypothetical protein